MEKQLYNMKDHYGNNIKLVEETHPTESRYEPGFTYYNAQSLKVTLLRWEGEEWMNRGYWKATCEFMGISSEINASEYSINIDCGIWVYNPIDGKTYEYLDEYPIGVVRPIKNNENEQTDFYRRKIRI